MFNPASFWQRAAATIVDGVALSLMFIFIIALAGEAESAAETASVFKAAGSIAQILILILSGVYSIGFWIWKDATPGKMLLKLRIVDARTGQDPNLGQYIIRYIGYTISAIPLYLGFIWAAFDKKKQGWHDKMAGTLVISE